MKRFSFLAAAVLAGLSFASCNKDFENENVPVHNDNATVYVSLAGHGTRVVGIPDTEAKVNNLQVFIFDGDGKLVDDGYGKIDNALGLALTCEPGNRTIWALVNGTDCTSSAVPGTFTLDDLKDITVALEEQSSDNFVMSGSTNAELSGPTAVSIDVNRYVSRVVIKKIVKDFAVPANQDKEFKIKSIYLENVQGENNVAMSAYQTAEGKWYNKMGYEASNSHALIYDALDVAVEDNYTSTHSFYAMPNNAVTSEDTNGGSWSPRITRLVIEATLDGETMYYPINMNLGLERNKSYEIEELIITKKGSSDPDTPVTTDDIPISIVVKDWTQVLVNGTGSITI